MNRVNDARTSSSLTDLTSAVATATTKGLKVIAQFPNKHRSRCDGTTFTRDVGQKCCLTKKGEMFVPGAAALRVFLERSCRSEWD